MTKSLYKWSEWHMSQNKNSIKKVSKNKLN